MSAVFAPGAAAVDDETGVGIVARGAVLGIDVGAEGLRAADFFTAFLGAARFFAAFFTDFLDDFFLADFLATFLATFFFAAFLAARFLVDFLAVFFAAGRRFLEAFLPDFFADFLADFLADCFFIARMTLLRCTSVRRLRRKPAGLPLREQGQNPSGHSSAHADALSPRHPQKCVCDSANPRNARNGQRTDR
ncbi:MAG: hypothetical protein ACXW13_06850 [Burkholderiaceae bacterium]